MCPLLILTISWGAETPPLTEQGEGGGVMSRKHLDWQSDEHRPFWEGFGMRLYWFPGSRDPHDPLDAASSSQVWDNFCYVEAAGWLKKGPDGENGRRSPAEITQTRPSLLLLAW